MHEIEILRQHINQLENELRFHGEPYPDGLVAFPGVLQGQGFFPGGDGLWRECPTDASSGRFPLGGIMVLGNDFGCLSNSDPRSPGFMQCLDRDYEDPPTWGIKEALRRAGLPGDRCFFTNAYLGLRTALKTTGASPGVTDSEFQKICREFFEHQLVMQRPSLIVCLGHEPRKFVAATLFTKNHIWGRDKISFPNLDRKCDPIVRGRISIGGNLLSPLIVVVAHPSYAWSTHAQSPRSFAGETGKAAEDALLAAAWQQAQQYKKMTDKDAQEEEG
jgi:hypothetical protein